MQIFDVWCDRISDRLIAAEVAGGNILIERNEPSRDEDLPVGVVYVTDDKMQPDGPPNQGVPDFVHTTTIVVEIIDKAASGPALKSTLFAHAQLVLDTLLPDHTWWQDRTDDADAESIDRVDVKYDTPPEGELIVGRLQVHIDLKHRTTWPPAVPDALETIHVTTPVTGDRTAPINVQSRIEPEQEE